VRTGADTDEKKELHNFGYKPWGIVWAAAAVVNTRRTMTASNRMFFSGGSRILKLLEKRK
jgi:hypothetical protein